jgi:hypothetical protein
MRKSWPHVAASNYLYLFVWVNFCILFIFFLKWSFCNGPETELKCNTGLRETIYNLHFIIYGQLVLSFLAVMYLATVHIKWASVLAPKRVTSSISVTKWHNSPQWGSQQEYFHMKQAVTNTFLVTAKHGRVNWASYSNVFTNLRRSTSSRSKPSRFFRKKRKARCKLLGIKKKKQMRSRRLQGGEKNAIHEVHMYTIG